MRLTKQQKGYFWLSGLLLILVSLLFLPVKVDYNIHTKGLVIPAHEWSLARTIEGNLVSSLKDNIQGSVKNYNVTEFQRGDVVEFKLNEELFNSRSVQKGDTIGMVYSNEEQRKLLQLQGEFDILYAELRYYTSGQKPEDVERAKRQLILAQQEVETQRRLMDRSQTLFRDSLISEQNYELELNALRLKEMQHNIAEAEYMSATTGDKPEQAELISTKMGVLKQQIDQIRARINYFTLISPVSGMVVMNRGAESSELLINIIDTSAYVVLTPLDMFERSYVKEDLDVRMKLRDLPATPAGKIISIDNVVQVVDNRQAFFATALFRNEQAIAPGLVTEILIQGEQVSPLEYAARIMGLTTRK